MAIDFPRKDSFFSLKRSAMEASNTLRKEKLSPIDAVYTEDAIGESDAISPERDADQGQIAGQTEDAAEPSPAKTPVRTLSGAIDDDRRLSFDQIHKKYHDKIFNLILRVVGDHEDAKDLTQTTFINAYGAWGRFRGEARVSTWLYQIAVNNCKNRFKQRDRQREREPISLDDSIETDSGELTREVADWRDAPERVLLDQELAAQIRRAVEALPPEYRTVLILQQEDLSYEDIARITGLTVQAVKTCLHRARNRVRQRLEPYYRGYISRGG